MGQSRGRAYYDILSTLREYPRFNSITELKEATKCYHSFPTVSRAVIMLERDGLISTRRAGSSVQILAW